MEPSKDGDKFLKPSLKKFLKFKNRKMKREIRKLNRASEELREKTRKLEEAAEDMRRKYEAVSEKYRADCERLSQEQAKVASLKQLISAVPVPMESVAASDRPIESRTHEKAPTSA